MPAYYDAQAVLPRFRWSQTVWPRVLRRLELWLCLGLHFCLVILLRMEGLQQTEAANPLVPPELAAVVFVLALLSTAVHTSHCNSWQQALTSASAQMGEQTKVFVQELQATFGRSDEVLALRFAAAKYALAAVYLFFFAATSGAVTSRGWGELRAKGLLDDREMQFMESQYSGDRIALLHIWAMWAAQEAASSPAVKSQASPEALAAGLSRLSAALRKAAAAAREAASCMAEPVPYHRFQLQELLLLASLIVLAAVAAPSAASSAPAASALYLIIVLAMLGLNEATAVAMEPFRHPCGFPLAATINATSDAIVQLLIASTPAAFDPSAKEKWWDLGQAIFSQGQIERRTPESAFGGLRANPCHWQEVKPAIMGDQAPPPLLDVGCCHLDTDALPHSACRDGKTCYASQLTVRLRQDGVGLLLDRLLAAVPTCEDKGTTVTKSVDGECIGLPSEVNVEKSAGQDEHCPHGCTSGPGSTQTHVGTAAETQSMSRQPLREQQNPVVCSGGAVGFCGHFRGPRGLLRLAECAARGRSGASVSPADEGPVLPPPPPAPNQGQPHQPHHQQQQRQPRAVAVAPVGAPRPIGGVTAPRRALPAVDGEDIAGPAPRCMARNGTCDSGGFGTD